MDDDCPPNDGVRPLKQGLIVTSENSDGDGEGYAGDIHGHLSIVDSDLGVAEPICVNVA